MGDGDIDRSAGTTLAMRLSLAEKGKNDLSHTKKNRQIRVIFQTESDACVVLKASTPALTKTAMHVLFQITLVGCSQSQYIKPGAKAETQMPHKFSHT